MQIVTIVGARPQFIKAATVSRVVAERNNTSEIIVHTGQHFDENMSQVFFDELEIPRPNYNLEISGSSHGRMTGRMLEGIEGVLMEQRPDWVLVYGDTNSTLAGALAAVKLHIPVAHVEAGLRSFNRAMPEEVNRVLTDHAADLLLTPTDIASRNLANEGLSRERVVQVGDVMYDAALFYRDRATDKSDVLQRHGLDGKDFVLCTVHRQENTDSRERLEAIFRGLQELAADHTVVLPLHPRTRARLESHRLMEFTEALLLLPPVGYLDMVMLEKNAEVVVTDSGGVQKEAYFHGVPCVTLRDETEWTELLDLGWNHLAPPGRAVITEAVDAVLSGSSARDNPYGDGDAASRIVDALEAGFSGDRAA